MTISLPATIAQKAESLAQEEGRTLSELLCEAFTAYQSAVFQRQWKELREYAATRNPNGYTEEDIPRLIKEVRAEMTAERTR